MRSVCLLLPLGLLLAACSGSPSASTPKNTATPSGGLVYNVPTATPGKGHKKGAVATANPRVTAVPPAALKTATVSAPAHFPASAYTAVVYGTVYDASGHRPLAAALVQVADGQHSARTNSSGQYRVGFPSGADASLQVKKAGYQCGLEMGKLKPGQSVRQDWQCQKVNPKHPVPPPFPAFLGTPPPGAKAPGLPPGPGAPPPAPKS